MDEKKVAIQVKGLEKAYKLYDKPSDRLKEALGFGRKKRYKEHYALKGVDMTIYQGETVGIIGTNGSGKSTILKIITGVLNPTGGSVHVNGRISALLELGAGFNMEYNGIENIYLNGTMIGFSKKEIDAKMDDILNFIAATYAAGYLHIEQPAVRGMQENEIETVLSRPMQEVEASTQAADESVKQPRGLLQRLMSRLRVK